MALLMLSFEEKNWLKHLLGNNIRFNEPMAQYTSFKIGGPADALAEPVSGDQLKELIQWLKVQGISWIIIGSGTNLLVRDGGIRAVVIRLSSLGIKVRWTIQDNRVILTVAAGLPLKRLCAVALRHGWQGMNFALGIPGTLGGAIRMNAGTAYGCIGDVLHTVTAINAKGEQMRINRSEIDFVYRDMRLPGKYGPEPVVFIQADIELRTGHRQKIKNQARHILQQRMRQQPTWLPSAGSFFKNPSPDTPAGRLIDEAGFKGMCVGQAQVSPQHANFIVNCGQATAAQILQLMERIQDGVWQRFNIRLEPEVKIIGQEANA